MVEPFVSACTDREVSEKEVADGNLAMVYLNGLIKGPAAPSTPRSLRESIEIGERRLDRFRRFLARLGDPQNAIRCVHVGGTSGKGSVAVKVAAGLSASGLRTGLHCTPYLQTALEKLDCDGQLARPAELVDLVEWIRPHVDAFASVDPDGGATYGMVWVALTFEYFRRKAVDMTVIEVGAGGRYDLTNVVRPDLVIVTSVGHDHLKSLGGTLRAVAWHKAGAFKAGAIAMSGPLPSVVRGLVRAEAAALDQTLVEVALDRQDFRVANTQLAEAALDALGLCGTRSTNVSRAIARARLPGRFERMPGGSPTTYLDGAHNRDKARALGAVLTETRLGRPRVGIVGLVGYRSASDVLGGFLPQLDQWVATEPRVYGKPPLPASELAQVGTRLGCSPDVSVPDPQRALAAAFELAGSDGTVISAGSIYLAGNLRSAWYPVDAIVRERTMWPSSRTPKLDG